MNLFAYPNHEESPSSFESSTMRQTQQIESKTLFSQNIWSMDNSSELKSLRIDQQKQSAPYTYSNGLHQQFGLPSMAQRAPPRDCVLLDQSVDQDKPAQNMYE